MKRMTIAAVMSMLLLASIPLVFGAAFWNSPEMKQDYIYIDRFGKPYKTDYECVSDNGTACLRIPCRPE